VTYKSAACDAAYRAPISVEIRSNVSNGFIAGSCAPRCCNAA